MTMDDVISKLLGNKALYSSVFDNDNGRRVLADLLRKFVLAKPVLDKERVLFNEGCKYTILYIWNLVYKDDARLIDELRKSIEERES
jgi:hypothetical protein